MDLTRFAVDAGQFINRAVQYTEEALGQAEKTALDSSLEELLARAESTKTWTDQIISQTEVVLEPSPGARLEDKLYDRLDWSTPPRPRAPEVLGNHLIQAGQEIGPNTPYGTALVRFGEAQKHIGEAERQFIQSANIHFLTPLRNFTEAEYTAIQEERRMLVNKRLDLDIAKTRVRKAHEADAETRNLNASPLVDDYVAHFSYMYSFLRVKWLKMWAQEISQAEMELRICQSLFDRQTDITRQLLDGISTTHANHMRSLTDYVEAQACFYSQCHQYTQDLQKHLARIPSVLCSNNWQSAANSAFSEPSTISHVVKYPTGLSHQTPVPFIIHHLPDSTQDTPTANILSELKNGSTGLSETAQPCAQENINNNNTLMPLLSRDAPLPPATRQSTVTTQLSANKLVPGQILTSQSDSPSSALQIRDISPAPNTTTPTYSIGNAPSTSQETASQPLGSSGACSHPLKSN